MLADELQEDASTILKIIFLKLDAPRIRMVYCMSKLFQVQLIDPYNLGVIVQSLINREHSE